VVGLQKRGLRGRPTLKEERFLGFIMGPAKNSGEFHKLQRSGGDVDMSRANWERGATGKISCKEGTNPAFPRGGRSATLKFASMRRIASPRKESVKVKEGEGSQKDGRPNRCLAT